MNKYFFYSIKFILRIYIWVVVGLYFVFVSNLLFTTHHFVVKKDLEYHFTIVQILEKTNLSILFYILKFVKVFALLNIAVF